MDNTLLTNKMLIDQIDHLTTIAANTNLTTTNGDDGNSDKLSKLMLSEVPKQNSNSLKYQKISRQNRVAIDEDEQQHIDNNYNNQYKSNKLAPSKLEINGGGGGAGSSSNSINSINKTNNSIKSHFTIPKPLISILSSSGRSKSGFKNDNSSPKSPSASPTTKSKFNVSSEQLVETNNRQSFMFKKLNSKLSFKKKPSPDKLMFKLENEMLNSYNTNSLAKKHMNNLAPVVSNEPLSRKSSFNSVRYTYIYIFTGGTKIYSFYAKFRKSIIKKFFLGNPTKFSHYMGGNENRKNI